ncbi:MAG TPA: DUF2341 domain-containing protein [Candidatus Peribacteraceae bacterium]|nr:DUF2341 domain-containing protein [Candidatus Peribacteraceae bacterium]
MCLLCSVACVSVAHAATVTWSGGGNDGKCSTTGNWSGGAIPKAGDDVVFNSTSNIVTWDSGCPSGVKSISLNTGFTGRLLLGQNLTVTGSLTVGSNQLFDLQNYDFTATNAAVTNNGTILLAGSQSVTGFVPNTDAGTIEFDGTGASLTTAAANAFYNLVIAGSGSTYQTTHDITVHGDLSLRGPYAYQKAVTINHAEVNGSSDLTDFPIYFSTTDTALKSVGNGGHVWSASGFDIIFTNASGVKLDHEINSYDPTTGAYSAWVRIPTLSHTTDTTIYLVYGNPHILSSQENKTGVWDSNYIAVYHLNDSGSLVSDSTQYNDTGALVNAVQRGQTGLFGRGYVTTSGQGIKMTQSVLNSLTQLTMEAWVNSTYLNHSGNYNRLFGCAGWSGAGTFCNFFEHDGTPYHFDLGIKNYNRTAGSGPGVTFTNPLNTWHNFVTSISQTGTAEYVDGTSSGSTVLTGTGYITNINPLYISYPSYEAIYGTLDEVRISNTVRSSGWIATEYANESSPSTFYSIGSESAQSIMPGPTWKLNGYAVTAAAGFANDGNIVVGTGSILDDVISLSASAPAAVGGSLSVTLNDPDQNLDGTVRDTAVVTVTDPDGDSENLTLTETSNDSGIFTASLPVTHGTITHNDGNLENLEHQNFFTTVTYTDPHDSADTATVQSASIADTQLGASVGATSGGGGATRGSTTTVQQIIQSVQQSSAHTQSSSQPATPQHPTLQVSLTGQTLTFRDIPATAWFASPISTLIQAGIAQGYTDSKGNLLGLFGPSDPVTFAQVAKMILLTAKKDISPAPSGQPWFAPYIAEAHALHLSAFTSSLDVNTAAPRGAVIQSLLEALHVPLNHAASIYTDVPESSPYSDAITTATQLGIIEGDTDANGNPTHTFRPLDPINRAEVAKILSFILSHPVK